MSTIATADHALVFDDLPVHPIVEKLRRPGLGDALRCLPHLCLDAASPHGAENPPIVADEHLRPFFPGRRPKLLYDRRNGAPSTPGKVIFNRLVYIHLLSHINPVFLPFYHLSTLLYSHVSSIESMHDRLENTSPYGTGLVGDGEAILLSCAGVYVPDLLVLRAPR